MFNAGTFVDDLKKGYVSKFDMHQIMPHPINLCLIELTGAELKEMYLQAQTNEEWPQLQIKGLGFRGVVFGKLLMYNIKMNKKRELMIGNQIVRPLNKYKLATLDLFTFGYFFPTFKYAKKQYFLPTFLRDIFLTYLENTE